MTMKWLSTVLVGEYVFLFWIIVFFLVVFAKKIVQFSFILIIILSFPCVTTSIFKNLIVWKVDQLYKWPNRPQNQVTSTVVFWHNKTTYTVNDTVRGVVILL